MKNARSHASASRRRAAEIADLRQKLADANETLRAIRDGEVDTVAVAGTQGRQVFTLEGAEQAYRVLIESMNEGAVTLGTDKTILYANQCFARMVKSPLERVTGGSFGRYLSDDNRASLRALLINPPASGSKMLAFLHASDGSRLPVQISVRPVSDANYTGGTLGVVISDMTEAHQNQERLRALAQRVVQAQEAERGRVALELHDHITQLLCAIGFESQALAAKLSQRDPALKKLAAKLNDMLGHAGSEVERISRNLRPSLLDQLGLVAVLKSAAKEFQKRTRIPVEVCCTPLPIPLTADTELTLYRILQEALTNVEKHARPQKVSVNLSQDATHVQLTVSDDGIGFDAEKPLGATVVKSGLGLLGMRERATYVSGAFAVKSTRDSGTTVEVRIPLATSPASPAEL